MMLAMYAVKMLHVALTFKELVDTLSNVIDLPFLAYPAVHFNQGCARLANYDGAGAEQ